MLALEKNNIPTGWLRVPLGEILSLEYGKGLVESKRNTAGNVPVYGSSGLIGYHSEALTKKSCIVVGRKGSIGSTYLSSDCCWVIDTAYYIEPPEGIDLKFLFYLLRHLNLKSLDKSTTIPSLVRDSAYELQIPLIPSNEQKRIVSKIEELFSLIDQKRELLGKISIQLQQYKASLIRDSISGLLSQHFRESNIINPINDEIENKLVHRLPSKKIKTLPKLDISALPKIPSSWRWINFSILAKKIKRGPSMKCNTEGRGIRYVTSGNILDGNLRLDLDYKFLTGFEDVERCRLKNRDLLLNCVNSPELIGKSAVVENLDENAIVGFNNYAIELWDDFVLPKYANIFFQSHIAKILIHSLIKRAVNQASFATRELDYIPFPLSPILEQKEIAKTYEERISIIQNLQEIIYRNELQLGVLRNSILIIAFRGKLVPQDPNDEPANVILEKIKQKKFANC